MPDPVGRGRKEEKEGGGRERVALEPEAAAV